MKHPLDKPWEMLTEEEKRWKFENMEREIRWLKFQLFLLLIALIAFLIGHASWTA